jgi:hypothetical protein
LIWSATAIGNDGSHGSGSVMDARPPEGIIFKQWSLVPYHVGDSLNSDFVEEVQLRDTAIFLVQREVRILFVFSSQLSAPAAVPALTLRARKAALKEIV